MAKLPTVGELRWPVLLARRDQLPDTYTGITETLVDAVRIRAKIEDLYGQTFYAAMQTDRPITHLFWVRWLGWIDTTYVLIRTTRLPAGMARTDVFRIRRVKEMAGPKRFLEIEAELEKREAG